MIERKERLNKIHKDFNKARSDEEKYLNRLYIQLLIITSAFAATGLIILFHLEELVGIIPILTGTGLGIQLYYYTTKSKKRIVDYDKNFKIIVKLEKELYNIDDRNAEKLT